MITSREHVFYLSGFSGSSGWLLIDQDRQILLSNFRYRDQANAQSSDWDFHMVQKGLPAAIREMTADWVGNSVALEGDHLTVRELDLLTGPPEGDMAEVPQSVRWTPTHDLLRGVTLIKDQGEIDTIARAAAITDRIFDYLVDFIKPGMTERRVSAEIEYQARILGADSTSFPSIVASGPNAALPHATVSEREIAVGDMITIDMGVMVDGYASDMTRTVSVGEPDAKLKNIYGIVAEAQQTALDAVRPGMTGIDLDKVARDIITDAGYGEAFGHSLGHGVGTRVHEAPSLSVRSKDTVQQDMIVTIEPGIYLTGWGGVRIEDLVAVGADGPIVLSHSPKNLITLK